MKRNTGVRGFIAVFHDGISDPDRPLRLLLRRINRLRKDIALGWCRQDESGQIYITPNFIARDPGVMRETLAAFSRFDRQIQTEESFATLAPRRENGHLIAVSKRPRLVSDEIGVLLRLIGLGWVVLIFLRRDRIGTGFSARLPLKLGALFLLAAGVPSLLLVVSGSYALRDHAHVRRQMIEDFVVSRVRNFDERSEERVTAFEVTLARLVEKAQRQATDAARAAVFEPLRNTEVTDQMLVIDEKGRCLVEHFIQGSAVPEVQKKLVSAVGTEVVRKLRGSSEVDAATLSADAVTDFAGGIMGKGVLNAEVLIQGMKRFQTIRFGSGNGMFYENTLLGPDGRPEWLVHIGIDRNAFQNKYCLREYRSLRRAGDLPIRLSAVHGVHQFRTIIDEGMDGTITREIARLAEMRRVIAREVRTERGEEVLWIGFPCRMLDSYTLVAKAPLGSITIAIEKLWRQLWLLAGMLLCSGALMAWLLTEQVLLPLRDVATGIEAIARRDFRHRVPIRADDELGEIAGLLNRVTEGMHDLEVARVVQESLFPGDGLDVGEYGIYGASRAMTDIGGDYFDYRVVGERHLIGLVGDVAGHGVPAALIMGMAKSAFSLLAGPDRPLEQFMTAFNDLLVAQGTRRKHMMTVFCFILDLETGVLTVLNGGHNFPLLFRTATGRAEEVELVGHPLGVRRKVRAERGELDLRPGDALILYTDGVIESR
ncbi:MAG TPA: SpoIIE family protein phosphatase, partial [Candidatus Ozemobacteraceae bacterium]